MVSPRTRARLLQEAHDQQERGGDAAARIRELQEKMQGLQEEIRKHHALARESQTRISSHDAELEYLNREEQRLNQPLPIGAERGGEASGQRDMQREQAALVSRRNELLQMRRTALESRRTSHAAMETAREEWNLASADRYWPEHDVADSDQEFERILNEIAPPPAPAPAAPANGNLGGGGDQEGDNGNNRQ